MSFPKDFPPPNGLPPPPPPVSKGRPLPPTPGVKQPLHPVAKSKAAASHLARKKSPTRHHSPPRVPESLLDEAEKTAGTAEQVQSEARTTPKPPPVLKKMEATTPKFPIAPSPMKIPPKIPPRPLHKPPSGSQTERGSKERDASTDSKISREGSSIESPSSSAASSRREGEWKKPDDLKKKEQKDAQIGKYRKERKEKDWEASFKETLDLMAEGEFAGSSIGNIQEEEMASQKVLAEKEAEILKGIEKSKNQIHQVLKEILETEATFFDSIKNVQAFFSQLKLHFIMDYEALLSKNLKKTKPELFEDLSMTWGQLRDTSRLLIITLNEVLSSSTPNQRENIVKLLDLFSKEKITPHLDSLKKLTLLHPKTIKLIEKFRIEPPESSSSLSWINQTELRIKRPITDFLIMPVQRQPRYLLFLKEIVKHISRIPEYSDLLPIAQERLAYLEAYLTDLNTTLRKPV